MKVYVTGDIEEIAHSAWISTIDEIRAKSREYEDAIRVVHFLVKNSHTSPLESVTLTIKPSAKRNVSKKGFLSFLFNSERDQQKTLWEQQNELIDSFNDKLCQVCEIDKSKAFHRYEKDSRLGNTLTVDLLNFVKTIKSFGDTYQTIWFAFREERPDLCEILEQYRPIEKEPSKRVTCLGEHNMHVELIQFHNPQDCSEDHHRATWRVRCPLSIGVQMLRHRKGSFNMVSGRYRTIRQDVYGAPDDCVEIAKKFGEDMERFMSVPDAAIARYNQFMFRAKKAKKDEVISNDEYKRIREVARFILSEGRMTELYVTFYINDFKNNFLALRDSEHAQTEHIWIAQEMERTLEERRVQDQEDDPFGDFLEFS